MAFFFGAIEKCPWCGESISRWRTPFAEKFRGLHSICGGMLVADDEYAVLCRSCWRHGPYARTRKEAKRLWNELAKKIGGRDEK